MFCGAGSSCLKDGINTIHQINHSLMHIVVSGFVQTYQLESDLLFIVIWFKNFQAKLFDFYLFLIDSYSLP